MTTDDQRHALGARLRDLRDAAGISAAALGRAAGRSGPFLTEVERGERRPSPGTLRAVVAVLAGSDEDRRARLLEELASLGQATGQLADERPERRKRAREMARADRTRSAAIARGDDQTALAATERTLAALGSPALTTDELQAQIDEWSSPAELAKLQAQIDEWSSPAELAKLQAQIDEPLAEQPETGD